LTKSIEDSSSIVLDLDLSTICSDTITTNSNTSWTVSDSDYFSLDDNITITTSEPSKNRNYIKLGNTTLTEEKVEKLEALLDVIENAEGSEIKAMFDTTLALNKLKGTNK
jgi:hypothetical protein